MIRILISVAVVVTLVAGATYYAMHRHEFAATASMSPAVPAGSTAVTIDKKGDDEELKRKRLEGIGSVKTLKPVELGPTLEQEAGNK